MAMVAREGMASRVSVKAKREEGALLSTAKREEQSAEGAVAQMFCDFCVVGSLGESVQEFIRN